MKLKELLEKVFKDGPFPVGVEPKKFYDYTLYGEEVLSLYKEEILNCEEFSECESLEFLKYPITYRSEDDKNLVVNNYKVDDKIKFKGKCYLLSLALTPEMYDPNKINEPVKDGAAMTPTMYDPKTFIPSKKIILSFSPERAQNLKFTKKWYQFWKKESNPEVYIKKELRDLLDKVLNNPEEYRVKGERGVMVRGIFDSGKIETKIISDIPYTAFYFKSETNEKGEVVMKMHKKSIPSHLVNKFTKKFTRDSNPTEEEINKFLEENK